VIAPLEESINFHLDLEKRKEGRKEKIKDKNQIQKVLLETK